MAAAMTAVLATGGVGAATAGPIMVLPQSVTAAQSDISDVRYRRRHNSGRAAAGAALGLFALGASGALGDRYGYDRHTYYDEPDYGRQRYYRGHRQQYRNYGHRWRND